MDIAEIKKDVMELEEKDTRIDTIWRDSNRCSDEEKHRMRNGSEVIRIKSEVRTIEAKYEPIFRELDILHDDYEASTTLEFLRFAVAVMEGVSA